MTTQENAEQQVLFEVQGALGRITLNRPKALNSLTFDMVRAVTSALEQWRTDDRVRAVLVEGAGERGLCAGGDIRAMYDAVRAGRVDLTETFWAAEYRMNAALARYPKPVVGIMDGICMGGGVGISAHGSHRVVTERSKVGMPEVGIGFAPDVGGTYLLSRAPGELGTHLALTGEPVSGADALHCGLADHYVPGTDLDDLVTALTSGEVDACLEKYSTTPPRSELAQAAAWIDEVYARDSVEEILEGLRSRPEEEAQRAASTIATKSPTSLKVTLRELRGARELDSLERALEQEYRVSLGCVHRGDFMEGVRATVVDKDRNPSWSPATLADVDEERVAAFFERPAGGDLVLPT
ncbi:enoyl-CoA hydratase/isomerase family protein [Actinopolyspora mortivallis]|uniref:3-hydroxyisobutyryl-CoA hydrolase n=1 Tax=Actinopolyspora mortivallis TaxID=33906 RepID=A0A2T0GYF1_ACTMO|nr:enoyl-CoA hydratase/isomerase family protein [Actinopolyspora mortivallis]PRW64142.1 3-hydroxyisobutyryl-CoA hydrolase [Actinopolyspora mortivallis]